MSFENWSGQPNIGNRFESWCKKNSRDVPPEEVVEAFNVSIDTGFDTLREFLPENAESYLSLVRNLNTFLSGAKRVR